MARESVSDDIAAKVKALYYTMRSLENKLGGGEGIEGLYGTLACSGMQKVLDCMAANCGLRSTSRLVDVGAGIGRPLLHAVVGRYAASAWGVEIDRVKADKGNAFMRYAAADMARRNATWADFQVPSIRCAPIEEVATLDPATHAYSFWEGVPEDSRRAFGRLFCASKTLQAVAVGQRAMRGRDPEAVMEGLGFGELQLVDSFSVTMSGSGRSFTAYVFNRKGFVPLPLGTCAAAAEEAALQPATPHDSREPALIRSSSSSESTEMPEELERAAAAKWGHRTRSRSGALPRRQYSSEPSPAPSQAPAPQRKPRGATAPPAASGTPPRAARPRKQAAAPLRLQPEEGTPAVPGEAERAVLASDASCQLPAHAPGPEACCEHQDNTARPACLQLDAELAAKSAPKDQQPREALDAARAAAGSGELGNLTPRSAKASASQALRLSPAGGVQKACTQSPRKTIAAAAAAGAKKGAIAAAKTGNGASAKSGNGAGRVTAFAQAFRSRRAPVQALKDKFENPAGETAQARGLGMRPQAVQPSEA